MLLKQLFLPCLFLYFLPVLLPAQTKGDQLFDNSFVHEIRFYSPHNLPKLLDSIWLAHFEDTPYYPVDVSIDGHSVDSVGVRIKGNLSSFDPKRPLKIDFNQYVDGQEYDGIRKLNLQNADADNTFQRDPLGYYLFRQAGVKASRTAYAKVFLNDVYNGVYILVEQIDAVFLKEKFSNNDGTLYKNKDCSTVVDLGPEEYAPYNAMEQIVSSLSGTAFQAAIEQVLNTDACLRYFMIEHFIDARDNPIDVGCNYYLYFEPKSGRLYWIPWDLNYAFYGGMDYNLLDLVNNDLFKKLMSIPAYRKRYLELSCEFLQYTFRDDVIIPWIDEQAQLVRPCLLNDPFFSPISQFDNTIEFLKSFVSNTRQRFLANLEAEAFTCSNWACPVLPGDIAINELVASADSSAGIPDPSGGFADWVELYNNTSDTLSLEGFYLSNDRDFPKLWPFPANTKINPGAYLIVWADRDIDEPGLHANFKLDKSGGAVYLSYEDHTMVDSVYFEEQTTNLAYARVPNGSGPFEQTGPTFAAMNTHISGLPEPDNHLPGLQLYPNPVRNHLSVSLTESTHEAGSIFRLIDPYGRCVRQLNGTDGKVTFDLGDLPAGVYRVQAQTGYFVTSGSVFKIKN